MLFRLRNAATVLLAWGATAGVATAAQITSLSPQGEVARVRQVVAKFDAPAIHFGSQNQPAPLRLNCNDTEAAAGHGRWVNERSWVFDFSQLLPPACAARCRWRPAFAPPTARR